MSQEETLQRIFRDILWIDAGAQVDSLQLHDLSANCIRHALKTAYEAGFSAASKAASELPESFPQPGAQP